MSFMEYTAFYLLEMPRPDRNIRIADFCFVAVQNNKRRIYHLEYPVYGILTDCQYFKRIIFN